MGLLLSFLVLSSSPSVAAGEGPTGVLKAVLCHGHFDRIPGHPVRSFFSHGAANEAGYAASVTGQPVDASNVAGVFNKDCEKH
jgi:hypothetical protein